ncbi:hypothetical protein GA0061094_3611 [[Bacillus] enclensis]|uniref:DUF4878 domain-containing protein n=1 Tax=[Bacillus] enclensis TaxID=1402860 RepID=A0A1C4D868_9BACI|nr:hypothetical protein [[Bacillus] enclensis]QTC40288.1 hypothetical protein I7V34_13955 [Bacillus sp. V3]SCC27624.1 hypothetical protein GA0061094_3611 [[Bacillus] enclensis]
MRRRKNPIPLLLMGIVGMILLFLFVSVLGSGEGDSPEQVIEEFYDYERKGDFGNSWELFHSEMKKKFGKASYVQTKNHVFLGHMGVDSFEVEVGDIEEIEDFEFSKDGPTFKDVRSAKVDLLFDSQFGEMTISQICYVAREKNEWKILWDYDF